MEKISNAGDKTKNIKISDIISFCKKKGFVFQSSEIYGGFAGFFDYGPLGVELKNKIKQVWWKKHVNQREDIVGIDGSIILNPKVWVASGHTTKFSDILVECKKCHQRFRADQLIEEKTKKNVEGLPVEELSKLIKEYKIKCPNCGGELSEPRKFNIMFKTYVGPTESEENTAYLRPETAQVIFTEFKNVLDVSRKKLPFGIAQIGKSFRNEISPRNFLFRAREFEQAEIEYFIREKDINNCPYFNEFENYRINILSDDMQNKNEKEKMMSLREAFDKKIINNEWQAFWIGFEHSFLTSLGLRPEHLRARQHLSTERAHYSLDTWDLEFKFPFGWKEIEGIANRTTYDMNKHIKSSKKDLRYYDEETKEKIVPYVVAEPSLGIGRLFLAILFEAYKYDEKRGNIVLTLKPELAPIEVAVFPLLSNKRELLSYAKKIFKTLSEEFNCVFDKSGSIGRRYARQDEVGTPYCITIDFDSLKDKDFTLRFRDSTKQIRVSESELLNRIRNLIKEEKTD